MSGDVGGLDEVSGRVFALGGRLYAYDTQCSGMDDDMR